HSEREHRQPDRLLHLRQLGEHQREGHRDQHAAEEALQAAHRDHRWQIVGEGTCDREGREQRGEGDHDLAEREHPAEVVGERDHHDLADQIGRRDPRTVVDAGSDAALDVEQRGVGDLDVEDRHEGADHGRQDRDPDGHTCAIGIYGGAGRGGRGGEREVGHDITYLNEATASFGVALACGACSAGCESVAMEGITDMPGRRSTLVASSTIFTG
ncbi:hypothetical protein chiPu_0031601, partial [Chiloscyllium punctatum]|nr:hypothetical protein [Chiloscyllium punctatum]